MAAGRSKRDTPVFLPAVAVLLQMILSIANAADSLAFGQYLSGNQTLVSKQGIFELGFFRPGSSTKQYLGMWHKNVVQRAYVWVANRDKPISESVADTAVVKISGDGAAFAIFANTSSTTPIWSSTTSVPSGNRTTGRNSTRLQLLDTGNLVLVEGNSLDPSAFLWEGFDHLTDTSIPGTKIGYNRTAGKNWTLTSWKSSDDPSPGDYTYQIDPSGSSQYFLVWNRIGQPYWSTGLFRAGIFANIPELIETQCYGFNSSDPFDPTSKYVIYYDRKPCGVAVLFVDASGLLKWKQWVPDTAVWQMFVWMPRDPCQAPSHCGPYGLCFSSAYPSCQCLPGFQPLSPAAWGAEDYSSGCVRKAPLTCGAPVGDSDGFLPVQAVLGLPAGTDANGTAMLNNISSREECEGSCLRNCSCTAYSFDGSGCRILSGTLMNVKQVQQGGGGAELSSTLHLRLASPELKAAAGSSPSKKQHKQLVVGLVFGALALLLLTFLLACWCRHRYRRIYDEHGLVVQGLTAPYRYEDLRKATGNFSAVLGKGGFGSVYTGTLQDGTPIAVKKLTLGQGTGQGDKQFRSEVRSMAPIRHINVLELRGFCCHGPHRILVYGYMPNGSLDAHLFPAAAIPMPWPQRYNVAIGVARGLEYLHDKCLDRIVHCDIKPENILLDADMCPKLADFGMAKVIGRDFSRALTTMRGTVGYLAPEWISGAPITAMTDVYSYGMMLFEIVFGRRNREPPTMQQQQSDGEVLDGLSDGEDREGWFFPVWGATNITDLDNDLLHECDLGKVEHGCRVEEFRRAWRVAWWCIQDKEEHRPTMAQVIQMLEGVVDVGVPPIPRHLRSYAENQDAVTSKLSFHQTWQVLLTPTLSSLVDNVSVKFS